MTHTIMYLILDRRSWMRIGGEGEDGHDEDGDDEEGGEVRCGHTNKAVR